MSNFEPGYISIYKEYEVLFKVAEFQVSEFYSDSSTKVSELYILDIRQEDEGVYYCRYRISQAKVEQLKANAKTSLWMLRILDLDLKVFGFHQSFEPKRKQSRPET